MSSLSLALPCACPEAVCPFSPSLSVLLESVNTSYKDQVGLEGLQGRLWAFLQGIEF